MILEAIRALKRSADPRADRLEELLSFRSRLAERLQQVSSAAPAHASPQFAEQLAVCISEIDDRLHAIAIDALTRDRRSA